MPIEMPRGLPFAVDTWTPSSARKRHRFLTHAHRDHLAGISSSSLPSPVHASRLTILLALHLFPQLDRDSFVEMEVGLPVVFTDPDGEFTVTAVDANHCPGAVMFLFEGAFGNVLHTGDCRLTPDCLHGLPCKYITGSVRQPSCRIDYLFLDCTFGRCSLQFPSKEDAIQQVINCIWKQPSAPAVYLACDMLGQEEILVEVSRAFGSKIYVDKEKTSDCYHTLSHVAPEILTEDTSCRFRVIGFPRLEERAMAMLAVARAKRQPEPLFIRPSAQWYAHYVQPDASDKQKLVLTKPMRDEFGVWHMCFLMHSSRKELEQALQSLQPKWVISTTPPCLAMDLTYVKNHCFRTQLAPDDPLCKLLGISNRKRTVSGLLQPAAAIEAVKKSSDGGSFVKESGSDSNQVQEKEPALEDFEIKVEQPVTLFGRARFGLLQESELWKDVEDVEVIAEDKFEAKELQSTAKSELRKDGKPDETVEAIEEAEFETKEEKATTEAGLIKDGKPREGVKVIEEGKSGAEELNSADDHPLLSSRENGKNSEVTDKENDLACAIGSSKGLNANLRKLYRSMNVPVPRPLQSLVELMGASKRVKISPVVQS